MQKAAKLADKIAPQPGIQKRATLNQRVGQMIGTVGGNTSQKDMMSDLVSAELINQGKLDPKSITP